MDWIEQLTGLRLDNGNGMLELYLFLIVVAVIVAGGLYLWSRRQAIRDEAPR